MNLIMAFEGDFGGKFSIKPAKICSAVKSKQSVYCICILITYSLEWNHRDSTKKL